MLESVGSGVAANDLTKGKGKGAGGGKAGGIAGKKLFGLPEWLVLAGGAAAAYLGIRWYKNRNSSSSSAASPAADTSGSGDSGQGSGSGGGYGGAGQPFTGWGQQPPSTPAGPGPQAGSPPTPGLVSPGGTGVPTTQLTQPITQPSTGTTTIPVAAVPGQSASSVSVTGGIPTGTGGVLSSPSGSTTTVSTPGAPTAVISPTGQLSVPGAKAGTVTAGIPSSAYAQSSLPATNATGNGTTSATKSVTPAPVPSKAASTAANTGGRTTAPKGEAIGSL
jgi:hypothetical protein